MAEGRKKAKLAHEKAARSIQPAAPQTGPFAVRAVRALVETPTDGTRAVVELDETGALALVSPLFAASAPDGTLKPSCLACPAVYDEVARQRAVDAYARWASGAHAGEAASGF
jgi:hypothetical protein